MLFQQILDRPVSLGLLGDGVDALCDDVRVSTKFILSRRFAMMADECSSDADSIEKLLPFCRPPFGLSWVEVLQTDRHLFSNAEKDTGTSSPMRVGFLVRTTNEAGTKFIAHQLYSFDGREFFKAVPWGHQVPNHMSENMCSIAGCAVEFDLSKKFPDACSVAQIQYHPGSVQKWQTALWNMCSSPQSMRNDWGGEVEYLLAVFGMMNTRNLAAREEVDRTTQNRKRAKYGKPPLFSYSVCVLREQALSRRGEQVSSQKLRAHVVRGHFKVRKTGVFWWSPFVRGDASLGFKTKDYVLA